MHDFARRWRRTVGSALLFVAAALSCRPVTICIEDGPMETRWAFRPYSYSVGCLTLVSTCLILWPRREEKVSRIS